MVNIDIILIIFFAAKDGEALYSQTKQDLELTVAQIMNSLLKNTGLSWKSRKNHYAIQFSSVQFSHSVVYDSVTPWTAAHQASLSITNSQSLPKLISIESVMQRQKWTISFSVVPFSCLQSFPTSGSFQMSQLFASGGQNTGVSASTSVLPMNIQD